MTLTLLIDLDDTLLGNAMDVFIPAYTQALAAQLGSLIAPDRLIQQLMDATRKMVQNLDPALSLEQVFDQHFYPALGFERSSLQATIDDFYLNDFPRLRSITTMRAQAVRLIDEACARGYQIAIATNPLFPRTAILQRLEWAGLSADKYPFKLIPGYETFHFAKPNLEFFAEMLGQLGWLNSPVVMVGNDWEMDILPAQQIGLPTYLVTQRELTIREDLNLPHAQGKLEDLLVWLDLTQSERLKPNLPSPKAAIATLRATPAVLGSLTSQLPLCKWQTRPAPEEWSLTEIICHFRDVELDVNLPRINRILQGDHPFITGQDTDQWAIERDYQHQDGLLALKDFIAGRKALVEKLENLPAEAWKLPAQHAIFGPIRLHELLQINISHDFMHLRTVRQLIDEQS